MKLALALLFCAVLSAQDALVTGRVQHSSGMAIEHAGITLINEDTGVRRLAWSNSDGYYAIPGSPPGSYKITVRKDGFQTITQMGIRLETGQAMRIDFVIHLGTVKDSVTVSGGRLFVATEDTSTGTGIGRDFLQTLPLNGRGLLTLMETAPGAVITPAGRNIGESGQFSVNGQRAGSNYMLLDGVSMNAGLAPSGRPGQSAAGSTPGLTVIGSMHNLVSTEALEEFRLQTSGSPAEFGRMPGGQVLLTTRSGTNDFHGSLFEYFRNDRLNSNDWFANSSGLPRDRMNLHDFGGVFGGPLLRNRMFFFASYEGLRLRQPQTVISTVPSPPLLASASGATSLFLGAFPSPNGPIVGYGLSRYAAEYPTPAEVNNASLRMDHTVGSKLRLFSRYTHAPSAGSSASSNASSRTALGYDTLTFGLGSMMGPHVNQELRMNVSRFTAAAWNGGPPNASATLDPSLYLPASLVNSESYSVSMLAYGLTLSANRSSSSEWQGNVIDTVSIVHGKHQWSVGVDYRQLAPTFRQPALSSSVLYVDPIAMDTGRILLLNITRSTPVDVSIRNLSTFVQDTWKLTDRLTFTMGLRWEVDPAPSAGFGMRTVTGWPDPTALGITTTNQPFWQTSYRNLAPRLGIAYRLKRDGSLVVRASGGMYYDTGLGMTLSEITSSPPYANTYGFMNVSLNSPASQFEPSASNPPTVTALGYAPGFEMPRSIQWNAAVENAFHNRVATSITYAGARDDRLGRLEFVNNCCSEVTGAEYMTSEGRSNYQALQFQVRTRPIGAWQALASYSWSHSIDDVSKDGAPRAAINGVNAQTDRGNSDFDVRHSFHAAFKFDPKVFHGWALAGVFRARTGFPFDVVTTSGTLYEPYTATSLYSLRPDLVYGVPVWLQDVNAPGGRRLNPSAFSDPANTTGTAGRTVRQGSLGRNSIAGFPMHQMDLSVIRQFGLGDQRKLQFRVEGFNIFNHPNFGNPSCCDSQSSAGITGQSLRMLNQALGSGGPADGLNPALQVGGPRSVQVGLRFSF